MELKKKINPTSSSRFWLELYCFRKSITRTWISAQTFRTMKRCCIHIERRLIGYQVWMWRPCWGVLFLRAISRTNLSWCQTWWITPDRITNWVTFVQYEKSSLIILTGCGNSIYNVDPVSINGLFGLSQL